MYSSSLDGGWGWVVVAGTFIAQMLSDGISYGFGILYVDLMDTFHGSSAAISSIGSLSYGSFCFIGPVAGALTNKFGYRFVTILGAIVQTSGVFLSAFTPNLAFLYFSVGILIGVGGGMMYIASFVCVSAYFLAKRPLATSFSSCGSSAGTFVFGVLYRVCIDHYGWRGALLLFSGLMLNGVVCGCLFRPFSYIARPNKDMEMEFTEYEKTQCNEHTRLYATNHDVPVKDASHLNHCDTKSLNDASHLNRCDISSLNDASHLNHCDTSSLNDASHLNHCDRSSVPPDKNSILPNGIKRRTELETASDTHAYCSTFTDKEVVAEKDRLLSDGVRMPRQVDKNTEYTKGNFHDKYNVKADLSTPAQSNMLKSISAAFGSECTVARSFASSENMAIERTKQSILGTVFALILGTTNLNIFKCWKFVFYGISTFLYCFGYGIPFVLLPDMAENNGFSPSEASWVISECGIAAIIGKFVFGALSQFYTKRDIYANTKLNCYAVILSGIAVACAPWTYSYPVLLVIGGAFGFLSAAVNTLVTLVLIELLGEDKLADAFGWLNFFGGIGYISGPVVAGWLYDVSGTYIATFIATGVSLVLSGIVLFPIFVTDNCRSNYDVK